MKSYIVALRQGKGFGQARYGNGRAGRGRGWQGAAARAPLLRTPVNLRRLGGAKKLKMLINWSWWMLVRVGRQGERERESGGKGERVGGKGDV